MQSHEEHQRVLEISRLVDQWAEDNLGGIPDWTSLERVLPLRWCGGFMWMQRIESDGLTIELYKHGITRRYLNLDRDCGAHRFSGEGYVSISLEGAIDWVFEGIEEMGWSRETNYAQEFVARKNRALSEAGWTVITTGAPLISHDEQEHSDNDHSNKGD